jgi:hypothetical protein
MRETQPTSDCHAQRRPPPMKFSRLLLIAAALGAAVIIVLFVVLDIKDVFRLGHPVSSTTYATKIELVKDWDKSAPWLPDDATDIQIKEVKQYGPEFDPAILAVSRSALKPCAVRPDQSAYLADLHGLLVTRRRPEGVRLRGLGRDPHLGRLVRLDQEQPPRASSRSRTPQVQGDSRPMMPRHLSDRCGLVRRKDPVHRHAACYSLSPSASSLPAGTRPVSWATQTAVMPSVCVGSAFRNASRTWRSLSLFMTRPFITELCRVPAQIGQRRTR